MAPNSSSLLEVTTKLMLYYVKENDQEITILFLHSFFAVLILSFLYSCVFSCFSTTHSLRGGGRFTSA